jgi:hypothetical protein
MSVFVVGGQRGNKHKSKLLALIMMISHFNKQGRNGGMFQFCNLHWRGGEEDHNVRFTDFNKMRLYLKKTYLEKEDLDVWMKEQNNCNGSK